MESHYVSQSGSRGVSKKAVLISALALVGLIGVFCVYNLNTTSFNVRFKGPVEKAWADWKVQQKKVYGGPEDRVRFNIFKQNYVLVHTHNAKKESYTLALNKFADLTPKEFAALYTGATAAYRNASERCATPEDKLSNVKVPDTLDWRKEGRVGPVKDQARCGSCWAFSTTGALEGLSAKNGKIGSFSEQQLVDCTTSYGNQGCNGGWVQNAFHYIIDNGLADEADYPYKAIDQECKKDVKPSIKIQGCANVPVKSVDAMKEALQNGPIAVYVEASQPSFHLYQGGIVTDANCFADGEVDHAVLLVGYTEDAWIVKNSWSSTWGEEGYIRVSLKETADKNGICGILSTPNSYPL